MCSRPRTLRRTRPALSSTRMCLDVELSEIGNALATSVTRASDSARRARMARRVVSETAEKTRSSPEPLYSSTRVNIAAVGSGVQPPELSLVVQTGLTRRRRRTARFNRDVGSSPTPPRVA